MEIMDLHQTFKNYYTIFQKVCSSGVTIYYIAFYCVCLKALTLVA